MAPARLIVCETTSKWAVALRRQTAKEFHEGIVETRSLDDCWEQAVASPAVWWCLRLPKPVWSAVERVVAISTAAFSYTGCGRRRAVDSCC